MTEPTDLIIDCSTGEAVEVPVPAEEQERRAAERAAAPAETAPAETAPAVDAVLAKVQVARQEVAGYSPTNGTRQGVEALCDAVETLVLGPAQ